MPDRIARILLLAAALLLILIPAAAQENGPITVTDATGAEVTISDASRIITIGGAVTETVFALGLGDNVIAVDESSIYPEAAAALPQVGYLRFLAAEPILAFDPTLIITTIDAGPPEVLAQVRDAGVTVLIVQAQASFDAAIAKIELIAAALDRSEAGAALVEGLQADIDRAAELTATVTEPVRVLFLFLRGTAVQGAAGTGTSADEMIRLAGAENVVTDYSGYQPLSAEAIIAAAPDVIVTTSNGAESIGGLEAVLALPGVADTPAAENGRVIASMDDLYLLGFTPRLGQAILDLTYLLNEDIPRPLTVVARLAGDFDILLEGVDIAGYTERLTDEGPFTVFAPNNAAFEALPPGMLGGLFSSPISVQAVLGYHIVEGVFTAETLSRMDGAMLPTLFGPPLAVTVSDGVVSVNGVQVVAADTAAANGIIHIIDGVLIPERPR